MVEVRNSSWTIALIGQHRRGQQDKRKAQGCGFLQHIFHLSHSGSWDCRRSGDAERAGATGGTLVCDYCRRVKAVQKFGERGIRREASREFLDEICGPEPSLGSPLRNRAALPAILEPRCSGPDNFLRMV